ncbi:MAG TPA: peptidoglycan-binding domain-containing protein [Candidatus Udaeobacter sp.]
MKKLTSLLIGSSLALAGATLGQQPVEQQSPNKHAPEKTHATRAQPKPQPAPATHPGATQQHGATHDAGAMKQQGAVHEHAATNEPGKGHNASTHQQSATTPKTNVSGESVGRSTPTERQQRIEQRRKGTKGQAAAPKAAPQQPPPSNAGAADATQSGAATGQHNVQANVAGKAKRPAPEQVQQIKSQHTNFRAQPKPQQIPAVTFNQNHHIEGSDHWQGQHYQVFRSYHPEWHDQGWYHSHYNRVELIGGGYYYFNNGYWFPAWGYSPSAQYYAYDGPIYAGQHAEPPDKVIADVQGVLQEMGYYKGEVDGLLGPLTREALTAYQAEQGLTQTAAIDEPTLDSLGMS